MMTGSGSMSTNTPYSQRLNHTPGCESTVDKHIMLTGMFWNKIVTPMNLEKVYLDENVTKASINLGWIINGWKLNYGEQGLKSVHIEFVTIGNGPLSCKNNFFLPIKRYITAKFNQFPWSLTCLQQLKLSPSLTHSFFLHLWPSCVAASPLIEKGIAECVTVQLVSDCIKESYWA